MIDCEKEKAPENEVEKIVVRTCINDGGDVSCSNSCPPGDLDYGAIVDGQENCSCGIIVYNNGRQIFGDELNEYGIFCINAVATPLTELTALVRF